MRLFGRCKPRRSGALPWARLGVAVCMFPRGEVGAGVLVVSLSYGLSGPALTVAILSLALNLLCSGFFILGVKKLLAPTRGSFQAAGEQRTRKLTWQRVK